MSAAAHWDRVYSTRRPDEVSWYRAHLDRSLDYIARAAPALDARIIDVGGGESTLVDDLVARGYRDVTVLDVSGTALQFARQRLGPDAKGVTWLEADFTRCALPADRFDVWHDRAVFHFLTQPAERAAYVKQVTRSVRPGGYVIVATFGPQGPMECSGLEVRRYDAEGLHGEFGARFELISHETEVHRTPKGAVQQFIYCFCHVER